MKRLRIITLLLALLLGAGAALLVWPAWREWNALRLIASHEAAERDAGWSRLLRGAPPRVAVRLADVHAALAAAPDAAILEAGSRLRPRGLWSWERQPPRLALRERMLLAAGDAAPQRLAADEMLHCPLDYETAVVLPIFERLLASDDESVRERALESLCGWLGRERAELLADFDLPDDPALARTMLLAMSWAESPPSIDAPPGDMSREVVEAWLMLAVRAEPADARIVDHLVERFASDGANQIAHAYILSHNDDPRGQRTLERWAREGNDAARYALQARTPRLDAEQAQRILDDRDQPAWRARLAAWRLDDVSESRIIEILNASPTERDGSVYAAALLAERRLPRERAANLAGQWLRDFDDDFKRAGAMLAALLGEHAPLVREVREVASSPQARTAAQLALVAMGDSSMEFAHRASHKPDGDFNPDALLCLLRAGDRAALRRLVELPDDAADLDWGEAIQQRAMLIERFAPDWHADAGRPVGGDARGLRLHFDWLHARWLLEQRSSGRK